MSSLIINFPDCAKLGSSDPGERDPNKQDTITVWTDGCPAVPHVEGPPPLIPWYGIVLGAVILCAAIAAIAVVRFRAHETRQAVETAALTAQVELARAHKTCDTCGSDYQPVLKK